MPRASGLRPDDGDHQCFIPKKCVHKYTGHTKGVQAIEFFPEYGHLLLRYATQTHQAHTYTKYTHRECRRAQVKPMGYENSLGRTPLPEAVHVGVLEAIVFYAMLTSC